MQVLKKAVLHQGKLAISCIRNFFGLNSCHSKARWSLTLGNRDAVEGHLRGQRPEGPDSTLADLGDGCFVASV